MASLAYDDWSAFDSLRSRYNSCKSKAGADSSSSILGYIYGYWGEGDNSTDLSWDLCREDTGCSSSIYSGELLYDCYLELLRRGEIIWTTSFSSYSYHPVISCSSSNSGSPSYWGLICFMVDKGFWECRRWLLRLGYLGGVSCKRLKLTISPCLFWGLDIGCLGESSTISLDIWD
jgi:hypothetical protein